MSDGVVDQTTKDDAARRFRAVSAGILALGGGVLTIVGNLLQQRADIPRGNPIEVLDYIDGRPWFAAALAGLLGTLCWAMAFTSVGRGLSDPVSRLIARMAEPVLIVAAAVFAVHYAHDGFTSGVIADEWATGELDRAAAVVDSRVVEGLVGGTSILAQCLLGLALALYALALLRSGQFSRVLSWCGVIGSLGWFLGGAALFLRIPGVSFELLLPFVGLSTIWVLGAGIALLRRGGRKHAVSAAG